MADRCHLTNLALKIILASAVLSLAAAVEDTERAERLTLQELETEPWLSRIAAFRQKLTTHLHPTGSIPPLYSDSFSLHRWLYRYSQGHKEHRLLDDFKEAVRQLELYAIGDPQVTTVREAKAELRRRFRGSTSSLTLTMAYSKEGDMVHLSRPPVLNAGMEFNLVKLALIYKVWFFGFQRFFKFPILWTFSKSP